VRARLLAAAFLALSLTGCAFPLGYLSKQGRYLLADALGAKSAQALLADPSTDADTRAFLAQAREIRLFAVERLRLRPNANFTRYKEISRDHLVDVVSACASLAFEPYLWRYPFLGGLPYRGFYEREDAQLEAARLKGEGWDVIVRPVDSFSTLGFSSDPLYSFMKGYSRFELASLIFHEQTHATVFVRGQPQFNEELATYVGEEGALRWLREASGPDAPDTLAAVDAMADSALFLEALRGLAAALDREYQGALSPDGKRERKAELIAAFERRFAVEIRPRFLTKAYRGMAVPRVNNAYLSLYGLYNDDVPLIREYCQRVCGGDLPQLLHAARELARRGDVKEQMRKALGRP
jgi:predicted aminopeptidase